MLSSRQNVPKINITLLLWYFDVDKNHPLKKYSFCRHQSIPSIVILKNRTIRSGFFNNNGGNTNLFDRVVMRGTYHRSCTWQVVKHQICIE